jgi:dihydrofolate synthase/folylpolyglutamate synthase
MIRTIADAEAALRAYISSTSMAENYTLERMHSLLAFLGGPQESLRVVHVAGTSGKTSTSYFIRALAEAGGARTGLTVSPHMDSITERIQIGGAPLKDETFLQYLREFLPIVEKSDTQPSYFEIIIAFAYWVFAREKVDVAVVEVGLGGLLDATNTVHRADKLCIITDIGLDHTEILGETIPLIAAQKAGIIQPRNTVIVQSQSPEALDVITKIAKQKQATLHIAHAEKRADLPPFQQRNFGAALAAYAQLTLPALTPQQLTLAAHSTPAGRLEIYKIGAKTIIVDGAHNAQKLNALHEALLARGVKKTTVVCNMVAAPQQKIDDAIEVLRKFSSRVIVPAFSIAQDFKNRFAIEPKVFAAHLAKQGITAEAQQNNRDVISILLKAPEDTVVITGSLYLAQSLRRDLYNPS